MNGVCWQCGRERNLSAVGAVFACGGCIPQHRQSLEAVRLKGSITVTAGGFEEGLILKMEDGRLVDVGLAGLEVIIP